MFLHTPTSENQKRRSSQLDDIDEEIIDFPRKQLKQQNSNFKALMKYNQENNQIANYQENQSLNRKNLHFHYQWDQTQQVPFWDHNFENEISRKKFKIPFVNNNMQIDGINYVGNIELTSESTFRHIKTNIHWEHDYKEHISYEIYDIIIKDQGKEIMIKDNLKNTNKIYKHQEIYQYEPLSPVDFSNAGQAFIQAKIVKWYSIEVFGQEATYPSRDQPLIQNLQLEGQHIDFVHDYTSKCSFQIADLYFKQNNKIIMPFQNVKIPLRYPHKIDNIGWNDNDKLLVSSPIYNIYIEGFGYFKSPQQKIYIQIGEEGKPQNYVKISDWRIFCTYSRPGRAPGDLNSKYTKLF